MTCESVSMSRRRWQRDQGQAAIQPDGDALDEVEAVGGDDRSGDQAGKRHQVDHEGRCTDHPDHLYL